LSGVARGDGAADCLGLLPKSFRLLPQPTRLFEQLLRHAL
jgi:hypothetical protein